MAARFSSTQTMSTNGTRFTVGEVRALIDGLPSDAPFDVDQDKGYNQLDGTTTTVTVEGRKIGPSISDDTEFSGA